MAATMKTVRIMHPSRPEQGTLLIPEQCLAARKALGWVVVGESVAKGKR